ncbi:heavy-metal-associated domain-containing protein [Actinomadura formosensis]|uniref:heavy-metal-associated domain-containing protein n=1 Tax=Actinomadura formosensis TaxID=60706 RepID=UPI0008299D63|nr:heavy metal-associated domain-containing protein [Actinomadura formosensis]
MSAQTSTRRTLLRSGEFSCPSCVAKIEKRLLRTPGVTAAKVHFTTGRIEIDHDPRVASVDTLVTAVGEAGYRAVPSAF